MLKDSRTGDVGFVMPKLIAIDYRNLVMITVPMMEEQIDSLKLNITKHKSIINNQHDEIDLLKINVDDAKKQLEAENNIRLACEQEQARMKKWKVYTYVLAAATLVTLGLYAGK